MIDVVPASFGLLVGFLVGLTGVGGRLLYTTVTKVVGSVQHYRQRSVNVQVTVFLGLGSIPANLLGVATLEWIKANYDEEAVRSIMITIIAATLVLAGASLIFRAFFTREPPLGPKRRWR